MTAINIFDYKGHTIRVNSRQTGFEAGVYENDEEVGGGGFAGDTEVAAIERAKAFVDRRHDRRKPLLGFDPDRAATTRSTGWAERTLRSV